MVTERDPLVSEKETRPRVLFSEGVPSRVLILQDVGPGCNCCCNTKVTTRVP